MKLRNLFRITFQEFKHDKQVGVIKFVYLSRSYTASGIRPYDLFERITLIPAEAGGNKYAYVWRSCFDPHQRKSDHGKIDSLTADDGQPVPRPVGNFQSSRPYEENPTFVLKRKRIYDFGTLVAHGISPDPQKFFEKLPSTINQDTVRFKYDAVSFTQLGLKPLELLELSERWPGERKMQTANEVEAFLHEALLTPVIIFNHKIILNLETAVAIAQCGTRIPVLEVVMSKPVKSRAAQARAMLAAVIWPDEKVPGKPTGKDVRKRPKPKKWKVRYGDE